MRLRQTLRDPQLPLLLRQIGFRALHLRARDFDLGLIVGALQPRDHVALANMAAFFDG